MHALNQRATVVLRRLAEGLEKVGDHRRIDQSSGFMAASVELIDRLPGGRVVSVAHYYEQQGDLIADPEMTFFDTAAGVFPMTFRQDNLGVYQEAVRFEQGRVLLRERLQRDMTSFANQWMRNIAEQQF